MVRIPEDLNDAILILMTDNMAHLEEIKKMSEEEFEARAHHSMGRGLRNAWALWMDENAITKWFSSIGINHGDDRSAIIITSFYRQIKGLDINLEEQVEHYKAFWKREGFKDGIYLLEK